MSVNVDLFKKVADGINETTQKYGLQSENSVEEKGDACLLKYTKDESVLTLKYENDIFTLLFSEEADEDESKQKRLVASLLSPDAQEKDIKYVIGEFNETLTTNFGKKDIE